MQRVVQFLVALVEHDLVVDHADSEDGEWDLQGPARDGLEEHLEDGRGNGLGHHVVVIPVNIFHYH